MASFRTFHIDDKNEPQNSSFVPCMIIVQARMMSTRLPGKVLLQVGGRALLSYLIERLRQVKGTEGIVIATSHNVADNAIVHFCNQESLHYIRGSEEDVLSRFYAAADAFGLELIIRITSDCPLIDPQLIEKALHCFRSHFDELDYLSNTLVRTFPRGMDVEIFRFKALKEAFFEVLSSHDKEHVTPFIIRQPERFRLANIIQQQDQSHSRLTVDTPEDFELVRLILEEIVPKKRDFSLQDIMETLKHHPDWASINAHVVQK